MMQSIGWCRVAFMMMGFTRDFLEVRAGGGGGGVANQDFRQFRGLYLVQG